MLGHTCGAGVWKGVRGGGPAGRRSKSCGEWSCQVKESGLLMVLDRAVGEAERE